MPATLCKTHYTEQKVLSAIFNNISFAVTTCYVSLYTANPDKTGGGTECSSGGTAYSRQALSPVLSAGVLVYSPQDATGSTISFADVVWSAATGAGFGTVTAIGIHDASTSGNLLFFQTLASGVSVPVGNVAKLLAGNLLVLEA